MKAAVLKELGKTPVYGDFKMRPFRLLGLKRKIEIFVPDEAFFALHSLSYGVRKR